jgi:hypothetical protein
MRKLMKFSMVCWLLVGCATGQIETPDQAVEMQRAELVAQLTTRLDPNDPRDPPLTGPSSDPRLDPANPELVPIGGTPLPEVPDLTLDPDQQTGVADSHPLPKQPDPRLDPDAPGAPESKPLPDQGLDPLLEKKCHTEHRCHRAPGPQECHDVPSSGIHCPPGDAGCTEVTRVCERLYFEVCSDVEVCTNG